MTVCIAAICNWQGNNLIIGATDRMLTSGDVEFEPPQRKTYGLGLGMVVLMAGDAAIQADICDRTMRRLLKDSVTHVRDAAEIYAEYFADYRRRSNEREFLSPLGLDTASFVANQSKMMPEEVARLSKDMTYEELSIEAIITGVDAYGAHIYVVTDPGVASCQDTVGFAAIGIGANHAESQFMFARYHPAETFDRALYLVYSAKKRAEVAPGVGSETDIFSAFLGNYNFADQTLNDKLEKIYQGVIGKQGKAQESAHQSVAKLMEGLRGAQGPEAKPEIKGTGEEATQAGDEADKEGV